MAASASAPEERSQHPSPLIVLAQILLLSVAGLTLFARCWDADFLTYDDAMHIEAVPEVLGKAPLLGLFTKTDTTYLPLSFLSLRIDYELFGRGMEARGNKNWAPGIRIVTWLYHTGAAVLLWRILLLLGLSPGEALFGALFFAIHPTCCETVAWVSERKNAMAAMFGFAALLSFLKFENSKWRLPLTFLLYMLSLFSKPSSLGLLPLFPILVLFSGAAGLRGERDLALRSGAVWLKAAVLSLPLVALALFDIRLNLMGHSSQLIPPPGGSALTGAMTDADVLVRYLLNLAAPFNLSVAYYVEPIVSVLDARFLLYSALLLALAAATIAVARSRRRAILGWLWFVGALGPNLNLIGIPFLMEDRYIYLSIPGFVLILVETVAGLYAPFRQRLPTLLRALAPISICLLGFASLLRGEEFRSTTHLFRDAVLKQPLSAFAHFGLMQSYTFAALHPSTDQSLSKEDFKFLAQQERLIFLEKCPDALRFRNYCDVALDAATYEFEHGNFAPADHYFKLIAFPTPELPHDVISQAAGLRGLALLSLRNGAANQAYDLASQALKLGDGFELSLVLRARATLALAAAEKALGHDQRVAELRAAAKADLHAVPLDSAPAAEARKMLTESGLE